MIIEGRRKAVYQAISKWKSRNAICERQSTGLFFKLSSRFDIQPSSPPLDYI
jgi:hypothetical protein